MSASYRLIPRFLTQAEREGLCALEAGGAGWVPGRQGTGYSKRALARDGLVERALREMAGGMAGMAGAGVEVLEWDAWLLDYPAGVGIPPHTDPLRDGSHLRLNVLLIGDGAAFYLDGPGRLPLIAAGDALIFRPDAMRHGVHAGTGARRVWSVGCRAGQAG